MRLHGSTAPSLADRLEAAARAYAKIVDEVNKLPLSDMQRPLVPYKHRIDLSECAAWVTHQKLLAAEDAGVAEGRSVFQHTACISCHTVAGTQTRILQIAARAALLSVATVSPPAFREVAAPVPLCSGLC